LLDGVEVQSGGASYTVSNVISDHTLVVTFKITGYTILCLSGPNCTTDPTGTTVVTYGTYLTV